MTSRPENSLIEKEELSMEQQLQRARIFHERLGLTPWDYIPPEDMELAKKQHVALCCSDPYWIKIAKKHPGGELAFWSGSYGGAIRPSQKTLAGFSPEALRAMSIQEILEAVRERHPQPSDK